MTETATAESLRILHHEFEDQPDLLRIVTLGDLESEGLLAHYRERTDLFSSPVKLWVAGQTRIGKTTLGNTLFGDGAMPITGVMDCTDYIGLVRLKSNLWFVDTPGAGGDEAFENVARAALCLAQIPEPVDRFKLKDFTGYARKARRRLPR